VSDFVACVRPPTLRRIVLTGSSKTHEHHGLQELLPKCIFPHPIREL
jgi:hypothetical protein